MLDLTPREAPGRFLVAEYTAQHGETLLQVVTGLLDALNRERKSSTFGFDVAFEIDFKLIRAKLTPTDQPRDVTISFVDAVEKAWDEVNDKISGTLLVIDEIDRVAAAPGVATFFKVSTELMAKRRLESIVLLPVGMVGVQDLLKAEHESVGRVFEKIEVPTLSEDEAMEIVTLALEGTGVHIEPEVNREIARLSGGFPNPVHLLGSEAFEAARPTGSVGPAELKPALEAVVAGKWRSEFETSFIDAGFGKNREILRAMAMHEATDVPVSIVCAELNVKQPEISANIGSLMERDVIVRVDRGVYRIKEPLLRQYIRHMDVLGAKLPVQHRPRKRAKA